jgi:PII-like signaling protein
VLRIKGEHDGSKRYKARLIIKGFQQKERIDYKDIFSLVVKLTSIKIVLSIVAAKLAMKDEMDSLLINQTWELTKLPAGKKALHNKWVLRIKGEHDGSKRYKARLVVKGFQHKEGIDYKDIFSLVVKLTTIKIVLSIVAIEDLHLEQLDVKTTFLHGELE